MAPGVLFGAKMAVATMMFVAAFAPRDVYGHSYLVKPRARDEFYHRDDNNTMGCPSNFRTHPTPYRAGETIDVRYWRNNHNGGFIRWALVPAGQPETKKNFDRNVFFYTCRESGPECTPKGKPGRYKLDLDNALGEKAVSCGDKITLPDYLPTGDYVLQWIIYGSGWSFGNLGWAEMIWKSCADIRLTTSGTKPKPKCPSFTGGDRVTKLENKGNDVCFYFWSNAVPNFWYKGDNAKAEQGYKFAAPAEVLQCRAAAGGQEVSGDSDIPKPAAPPSKKPSMAPMKSAMPAASPKPSASPAPSGTKKCGVHRLYRGSHQRDASFGDHKEAHAMARARANIPTDSVYELQRSLCGVELVSYLTGEPVSEKKPSRFTDVAFHSVRPWLAAIDPKGSGTVWNYETREVVTEFALGISHDAGSVTDDAGDDEFGSSAAPTSGNKLLQKTASPTASYVRSLRGKASSFLLLFYDHESVCWSTRSTGAEPRTFFDEWLVVLTTTHVVLCDLNQPSAIRSLSSEELQRQVPCSIEVLPSGLLAIGCQDGKIRLWNPCLWRVVDTIDTGSSKEVQQLVMLPLRRDGDVVHFLTSVTLDGRVVSWKVSTSGECVKVPGLIELKDFYKPFDTSSGLNDMRWHEHQEVLSGTAKDGTTYFFDLTPLTRQSKQMTLMSILPTNKLPGACVLAGSRRGAFVVMSLAPAGSTVTISELVNKGRAVGKDNVPANYLEYAVGSSIESRDLRLPIGQAALKKYKMLSLCGNPRQPEELCCVTSFGIFVLRATCLPTGRSIMIARGGDKTPLVLHPGPCRITLRFYGEETSPKQEDYKMQGGVDAPNEKLKMPVLMACPSDASYVAAILPASAHTEIIQMDSELRNQKSINMHPVFSGNAIALGWHSTKRRFAMLVPQEPNARRLTRAASNMSTPRRRGFMFGGSGKGNMDSDAAADGRAKNTMARTTTLAIYDIAPDGRVLSTCENCSCGDDRMLHVFSGPLLGVVKFEAGDDGSSSGSSTSFVGANELHDSPSTRTKRAESAMFSPSSGGGSSVSLSHSDAEAGEIKKTVLEFFEWDAISGTSLKRVGSSAVNAPLRIEWERVTHRFCALVYSRCVKIYRATASPVPEVVCIHEIPTQQTAQSLQWMHHTLFVSTDDHLKCCVLSKTRVFTFDVAAKYAFLHSPPTASSGNASVFPSPHVFPPQATTILGIANKQLVVAAPLQSLHTIDLSNRVLQCCMLISIGQADLALQVADAFSSELTDWLASVFEAFGFVSHAMRLTKLSISVNINISVKHNQLDHIESLLQAPSSIDALPFSRDTTGSSLLQRACICLYRGGRKDAVERVCRSAIFSGRHNDAVFLASMLNDDELFASALERTGSFAGAFHASKRRGGTAAAEVLSKWNEQLRSAVAPWKATLERQAIRPPDNVSLLL